MDGLRNHDPRHVRALTLGLLVAAALYVPPLELAPRIDRALYDAFTRIAPPSAPDDIVLLELTDPAWLTTLARVAEREDARLLVTTQPRPPSPFANRTALGPVDVPIGDARLRRTEWRRGGHLWLRPDADGVVRREWSVLEDGRPLPSLAFAAARHLETQKQAASDTQWAPPPRAPPSGGEASRVRWLRFFDPDSFTVLTPTDVLAAPERLGGRIVVAGAPERRHRTPFGAAADHELIAQALAGYRLNRAVTAGSAAQWTAWTGGAILLALVLFAAPASAGPRLALSGACAAGLAAFSGAGFVLESLWIPVAGPAVLVAAAGLVSPLTARDAARRTPRPGGGPRKAPPHGDRLDRAWQWYRSRPTSHAMLAELYELARALEADARQEMAADVFHAIAQAEPTYRDAASRLVACTRPTCTPPVTHPPPRPFTDLPARLGRYELLEEIGHGATGFVYLARDPKIGRIVAVKVVDLSPDFDPDDVDEARQRFLREAETAGRLNHPGIVTIYDVGESGGLAYIAMEYLKGRRLSEFCEAERRLPWPRVVDLFARAADALDYAHKQNVVHRDIKPANIMYDSILDTLKITDFGIARLIDASRTRTGVVLGTPSFMAPEQLEGENVNGHTDLFALGVSLYQLLTARLPFRGNSMTKLMFVIANEPHQPVTAVDPGLPRQLDRLLATALAKNPAERFATGAEMADALRAIAAQTG